MYARRRFYAPRARYVRRPSYYRKTVTVRRAARPRRVYRRKPVARRRVYRRREQWLPSPEEAIHMMDAMDRAAGVSAGHSMAGGAQGVPVQANSVAEDTSSLPPMPPLGGGGGVAVNAVQRVQRDRLLGAIIEHANKKRRYELTAPSPAITQ